MHRVVVHNDSVVGTVFSMHIFVLHNLGVSPIFDLCKGRGLYVYVFVIVRLLHLNVIFCKLINYHCFMFCFSVICFIQIMALLPKLPLVP